MTTLSKSKSFSVATSHDQIRSKKMIAKFTNWCDKQEPYRFPILAGIVAIQGCIIVPITLILSFYYNIGISDLTFLAVSITTTFVMVTNMALASMRIVLGSFILSIIVNVTLILLHLPALFNNIIHA